MSPSCCLETFFPIKEKVHNQSLQIGVSASQESPKKGNSVEHSCKK